MSQSLHNEIEQPALVRLRAPASFIGDRTFFESWPYGPLELGADRTIIIEREFAQVALEVGWAEVEPAPLAEEAPPDVGPSRNSIVQKRRAQIRSFSVKQRKLRNWIAIAWAIEWLAKDTGSGGRGPLLNDDLVMGYIKEFRDALLTDSFARQINGSTHLRVLRLRLTGPHSRVTREDMECALGDEYRMKDYVLQLWVPRNLLLELFEQRKWLLVPSWLHPRPRGGNVTPSSLNGDVLNAQLPAVDKAEFELDAIRDGATIESFTPYPHLERPLSGKPKIAREIMLTIWKKEYPDRLSCKAIARRVTTEYQRLKREKLDGRGSLIKEFTEDDIKRALSRK